MVGVMPQRRPPSCGCRSCGGWRVMHPPRRIPIRISIARIIFGGGFRRVPPRIFIGIFRVRVRIFLTGVHRFSRFLRRCVSRVVRRILRMIIGVIWISGVIIVWLVRVVSVRWTGCRSCSRCGGIVFVIRFPTCRKIKLLTLSSRKNVELEILQIGQI